MFIKVTTSGGHRLLSDLSGFVSGQTLVVDGGHIMY